jgi:hypothetical protein
MKGRMKESFCIFKKKKGFGYGLVRFQGPWVGRCE